MLKQLQSKTTNSPVNISAVRPGGRWVGGGGLPVKVDFAFRENCEASN